MAQPDYAKRYVELGATFIAIGSDAAVLAQGAKQLQALYK